MDYLERGLSVDPTMFDALSPCSPILDIKSIIKV